MWTMMTMKSSVTAAAAVAPPCRVEINQSQSDLSEEVTDDPPRTGQIKVTDSLKFWKTNVTDSVKSCKQ